MPRPSMPSDALLLAARAAETLSATHKVAYAQIAPDLSLLAYSPNFPDFLFNPKEDIHGRSITDFMWEFVGAESIFEDILEGRSTNFRLEQVNREQLNGETIYLNYQVIPLVMDRPGQGLLLLVEDVSEYGRLQQTLVQDRNELRLLQHQLTLSNLELQRLNRLKSIFLSMAAHDLRTPLTAISGYAGLMLELHARGQKPNIAEYLSIVLSQTERLNRLISDFIDLDRIEEEKLTIHPEICDLCAIINEVTAVMSVNADSSEVKLTTNLPDCPLEIWADRDKLYRIIYNLVSNGLKYTPRTGKVEIKARQHDQAILIQVRDNGRGMNEAQVRKLFQMYYRTEEAKKSKTSGTGLGLYIVKKLAEAHQGQVKVQSEPGIGSTFTVRLPILYPSIPEE